MKIAISASSDDLNGQVNPVFGRCPGFLIVEAEGSEIKNHFFIPNTAMNAVHGAGTAAAQAVINQGVQAVISGNLGPNAFNIIQQAGIKFYPGFGLNIKEAIEKVVSGQLKEQGNASTGANYGLGAGNPQIGAGFGRGMGRGLGRGFGRGRGWGRGF